MDARVMPGLYIYELDPEQRHEEIWSKLLVAMNKNHLEHAIYPVLKSATLCAVAALCTWLGGVGVFLSQENHVRSGTFLSNCSISELKWTCKKLVSIWSWILRELAEGVGKGAIYGFVHRSDERWSLEELSSAKEPQNGVLFGCIIDSRSQVLFRVVNYWETLARGRFRQSTFFRFLPPKSRSDRIFDFGLFVAQSWRYCPGVELDSLVVPVTS